ncbi:MAG: DUF6886 family protein [Anaerolineae bacterium]
MPPAVHGVVAGREGRGSLADCLYHVSDAADIAEFVPRPTGDYHPAGVLGDVVWTIGGALLHNYLPPRTFTLVDPGAGYYVSHEAVVPSGIAAVGDLLQALTERDVELRVTPSLWPLRDAVVASTLQYSCIRMRHAQPRTA